MQPTLKNPVERIRTLAQRPGRMIIALAGLPGAGKSTVARRWQDELGQPGLFHVLGMDGFHLTQAQLQRFPDPVAAFARRGEPWTFDTDAFAALLRQLRTGESVLWPGFEHDVGDPVADAECVPASCRVVLVEGIYVLYREGAWTQLDGCFDEAWFLDTPEDVARERLIRRHQQSFHLDAQAAAARADANDCRNMAFVLQSKNQADYLVRDGT
jgi:pantothenate kinase